MNINDYKFKINDEVITVDGRKGKIIGICGCNNCKSRGFQEPIWALNGSERSDYITIYDVVGGLGDFYKIGEYRFNNFHKESVLDSIQYHNEALDRLKNQLRLIENMENDFENKE